ncbi:TRAP transporter small permease [Falsirhodobacter sp. alg1]|uniref:TRAP transporter small permease n=1 Tax=Falsirhodobacter sp. alg1 TaxID=1472418 RepID=UPI0005EFDC7C|nr:TRAP transporter small permease [Falsirhodobacter sp. alg1]
MARFVRIFFDILDIMLAVLISTMAIMVFVNVIMRYTMNSGIAISDELSRFAFVWLTFIGAVVAHHHHLHMGMETLVARFGRRGRMILMGASDAVILGGAIVLTVGTWKQLPINASMNAAVSGISMAWVYGIGIFTGVGIAIITAERLIRLFTGRITDEEIRRFGGEMTLADEHTGGPIS